MPDRNVQLPDGRILTIPDDATPDQFAQLRNKLVTQFADLKTGAGMEQSSQQQVRTGLAANVQPDYAMQAATGAPLTGMEAGLPSPAQDPGNRNAMAVGAAVGAPIDAVATLGPRALLSVGGGMGGAIIGRKVGGMVGYPNLSATIGSLIGGAGPAGLRNLLSGGAEAESVPMRQSPYADEYNAIRASQRAAAR